MFFYLKYLKNNLKLKIFKKFQNYNLSKISNNILINQGAVPNHMFRLQKIPSQLLCKTVTSVQQNLRLQIWHEFLCN